MKITHGELTAALIGARLLDATNSRLQCEHHIGESYEIADSGVYWLATDDRGLPNLGAVMWENVKQRAALRIDALEKALRSPGWYEPTLRVIQ